MAIGGGRGRGSSGGSVGADRDRSGGVGGGSGGRDGGTRDAAGANRGQPGGPNPGGPATGSRRDPGGYKGPPSGAPGSGSTPGGPSNKPSRGGYYGGFRGPPVANVPNFPNAHPAFVGAAMLDLATSLNPVGAVSMAANTALTGNPGMFSRAAEALGFSKGEQDGTIGVGSDKEGRGSDIVYGMQPSNPMAAFGPQPTANQLTAQPNVNYLNGLPNHSKPQNYASLFPNSLSERDKQLLYARALK